LARGLFAGLIAMPYSLTEAAQLDRGRLSRCIGVLILVAAFGACSEKRNNPTPQLSIDLKAQSYSTVASGTTVSYSFIGFLSNDLLLVAINERRFTEMVELSFVDEPAARFLLFNIRTKALVATADMALEKEPEAVQVTESDHFVIWNESGIQLCDVASKCGAPQKMSGPVLASPTGSVLAVGGWGADDQKLLDGVSLQRLAIYPAHNPEVVPGDGAELLRYRGPSFSMRTNGRGDAYLPIKDTDTYGNLPVKTRFLSRSRIAVNETDQNLLVAGLDGKAIYRVPTQYSLSDVTVTSCACETDFAIREQTHTRWNSMINFLDIEDTRPYDRERVRVVDTRSGRVIFSIEHDPRPYMSTLPSPALSPDGRQIALVDRGVLKVYEVSSN